MNCKKCGAVITEGLIFCPFCGGAQELDPIAPELDAPSDLVTEAGKQVYVPPPLAYPVDERPAAPPAPRPVHPVSVHPVSKPNSGLAIASLVCGMLGTCSYGALSVFAVILGWAALGQIRKSGGRLEGSLLAYSGLATGGLGLLVYGGSLMYVIVMAIVK